MRVSPRPAHKHLPPQQTRAERPIGDHTGDVRLAHKPGKLSVVVMGSDKYRKLRFTRPRRQPGVEIRMMDREQVSPAAGRPGESAEEAPQ